MKVFCCHSSEDKEIVKPIALALSNDGHEVFVDEWSLLPGDSLTRRIPEEIDQSNVFILFLSKAAKKSKWCNYELELAISKLINKGTRVITIRMEPVDPPISVAHLLYIDLTETNYALGLESLLRVVNGNRVEKTAEPYNDVVIQSIPITFEQKPPFEYYVGIRISAKRFSHKPIYLYIETNAKIADKIHHQIENWPGGSREMIATKITGAVFEYTESRPGLEPGYPHVFVLFSNEPISINKIELQERSGFSKLAY